MGRKVIRLGDKSNHGGKIITSSTDTLCNGRGITRAYDLHSCPIPGHGITPMVTFSGDSFCNGRGIVREGDKAG